MCKVHKLFLLLLLCSVITIPAQEFAPWIHHDFNNAMRVKEYVQSIRSTEKFVGLDGIELYKFFRNLYNEHSPLQFTPDDQPRIPRIIHQIWLGSPVPEVFQKYIKTWKENHPGWKYKLWTDADVKKLKLHNQELYDKATNYGEKSDILRYEILYRAGGVYVDMDFECLRSLDLFHYTYDFYVGIQPLDSFYLQLNNALIGSAPKHPILKQCIDGMKANEHIKSIPAKTGPIHLTKCFFELAGKGDRRDIALPALYFYPLTCFAKVCEREKWIKEGAYAVHHWARSWMPSQCRKEEFKVIKNDHQVQTWNG